MVTHKKKQIGFAIIVAVILTVAALSGCSGGGYNTDGAYPDSGDGKENTVIATSGIAVRKIAYQARVSMESDDIEKTADALIAKVKEYAAEPDDFSRVDSTDNSSSGYYSITVRVSAEKRDEFLDYVSKQAKVTSKRVTSEDLTADYYSYEAEKTAIQSEIAMLQAELDTPGKIEPKDAFQYTARISELNIRLNKITGAMGVIDERVDLSTIYITIYSSGKTPVDVKYTGQVAKVFVGSWLALVTAARYISLAVIAVIPFALIGAAITIPIIVVKRKKGAARKDDSDTEDKDAR